MIIYYKLKRITMPAVSKVITKTLFEELEKVEDFLIIVMKCMNFETN